MNNSNQPTNKSAAELHQEIADYILSHIEELTVVPGITEFVKEHQRILNEMAEQEARLERLHEAKAEYAPLALLIHFMGLSRQTDCNQIDSVSSKARHLRTFDVQTIR